MPKVSRGAASERVELEGLEIDSSTSMAGTRCALRSTPLTPISPDLFRGLPGDCAQLPRWGYVIKGKIGFRFADHEKTYEVGDAYYVPPGHTPGRYEGSEIVEFQPDRNPRRDDAGRSAERRGGGSDR